MRRRSWGPMLALLVALSACMTTSVDQLNGLMLHPIGDAMASFGKAPESHVMLPEGGGVYTWKWYSSSSSSLCGRPVFEVVTITTNSANLIVNFRRTVE